MDEIRRRTIDNAKTEAAGLARRLKQFIDEYSGPGAQVLTINETAWLAKGQQTLVEFENREVL